MSKVTSKHYNIAVYLILLLLAIIAAFIGLFLFKDNQSLQSLLLNISTEFGGAALIFFILIYFALDGIDTDSIEENLKKIKSDTELIKKSTDVQNTIKLQKQLNSLQSSVGHLTSEFGKLSDRVATEFSGQQKDLMQSLQAQFRQHIDDSREILESAITKELTTIVPVASTQKAVSVLVTEHIRNAVHTMAQFQSMVLEREMQVSLERATTKMTKKIQDVGKDVKIVQSQIDSLQSFLPTPSDYKQR